MAILADQATRGCDMDVMTERHVASARRVGNLKGQRQPDRAHGRNVVGSMASRAGQRASGIMMARGAVHGCPDARRAMGCAGPVTAAAGQVFVALVRKGPSDQGVAGCARRHARNRGL